MARITFSGARLLAAGLGLLLVAACGGTTTKQYAVRGLPADETATIETGMYANIERCDGTKLEPFHLKTAVLPGLHTVEMTFRRQLIGNRLLYPGAKVPAVTFLAEPGHAYVVNVALFPRSKWMELVASDYDWNGFVVDRTTGRTVAITEEDLPAKVQWINPGIVADSTWF